MPGLIDTPLTSPIPDKERQKFVKNAALHRIGNPQEIAEVIAFLASDKSSFISGSAVEINGGFTTAN